jgi:hypothetical protein
MLPYYKVSGNIFCPTHTCTIPSVRNLFQGGAKTGDTNKRVGKLLLTGYSPVKKKGSRAVRGAGGGRCMRGDGISPCNAFDACNDVALDVCNANGCIDSDNKGDLKLIVVNFLLVSSDFLEFVAAYQSQDITIKMWLLVAT